MRIKYKKVPTLQPFCGECEELLFGDNSYVNPFRCPCGTWQSSFQDPFEFKLINPNKNE